MSGGSPVINLENRAFHYGDGVFESIRVFEGKACFLDAHWTRLIEGLKVLRIERPPGFEKEDLARHIATLAKENELPHGRARLTVYRDAAGLLSSHVPTKVGSRWSWKVCQHRSTG